MLREEACLGLTDRKTQIYRNSKRKITSEKGEGEEKKNHTSHQELRWFLTLDLAL